MNVNAPMNDDRVFDLIKLRLTDVTERYAQAEYNSAVEMLGAMTNEMHELLHAVHDGKGKVSTAVLCELIDIAVVAIKGARSFMHRGTRIHEKS